MMIPMRRSTTIYFALLAMAVSDINVSILLQCVHIVAQMAGLNRCHKIQLQLRLLGYRSKWSILPWSLMEERHFRINFFPHVAQSCFSRRRNFCVFLGPLIEALHRILIFYVSGLQVDRIQEMSHRA